MRVGLFSSWATALSLAAPLTLAAAPARDGAGDPQPSPAKQPEARKLGYLGVSVSSASSEERQRLGLPSGVGLRVDAVGEGSPAAGAGLRVGEVLERLGDQTLVNAEQFRTLVRNLTPGATVELKAWGEAGAKQVKVAVGGREASGAPERRPRALMSPWLPGEGPGRFDMEFEAELPPPMWGEPFDLFVQPFEGMELSPELEKRFTEARERMREAHEAMRQAMKEHQKQSQAATAQASQRVGSFSDGEHTLTLKVTPQGRRLKVVGRDGEALFDGPIDTPEQRQGVPEAVRPKLERLEQAGRAPVIRWSDDERGGAARLAHPRILLREAPVPGRIEVNQEHAEAVAVSTISDGEHTLTVRADKDGKRLTAKNRQGQTLFDGPINTPEQLQAVPAELRAKLKGIDVRTVVPAPQGPGGKGVGPANRPAREGEV
jgi:hypothetical protein